MPTSSLLSNPEPLTGAHIFELLYAAIRYSATVLGRTTSLARLHTTTTPVFPPQNLFIQPNLPPSLPACCHRDRCDSISSIRDTTAAFTARALPHLVQTILSFCRSSIQLTNCFPVDSVNGPATCIRYVRCTPVADQWNCLAPFAAHAIGCSAGVVIWCAQKKPLIPRAYTSSARSTTVSKARRER